LVSHAATRFRIRPIYRNRPRRWAWTLGYWVVLPPQASYAPWAFTRAADGTMYYAPGSWRDASGKVLERPAALVTATADSVAIIDPEGNTEVTGRTMRSAPSATASAAPLPPPSASASPAAP
jgi:hypothetical protein